MRCPSRAVRAVLRVQPLNWEAFQLLAGHQEQIPGKVLHVCPVLYTPWSLSELGSWAAGPQACALVLSQIHAGVGQEKLRLLSLSPGLPMADAQPMPVDRTSLKRTRLVSWGVIFPDMSARLFL